MKKSTIILIITFITLFVISVLIIKSPKKTMKPPKDYMVFDTLRVDKIEILKPTDKVLLVKESGLWKVKDPKELSKSYKANQEFVQSAIRTARKMNVEDMISDKKEKHQLFQVDSSGTIVKIYEGNKVSASFIVGKMTQDYIHTYIRKTDSDKVYRAKGLLVGTYSKRFTDWRDKVITKFDSSTLTQIDFEYPDNSYTLAKFGNNWKFSRLPDTTTYNVKSDIVNQMVSSLSNLNAIDFGTSTDSLTVANADTIDLKIQLSFSDNSKQTISFIKADKSANRYFVKKGGDETIFTLYKGNISNIMKKPDEVKE